MTVCLDEIHPWIPGQVRQSLLFRPLAAGLQARCGAQGKAPEGYIITVLDVEPSLPAQITRQTLHALNAGHLVSEHDDVLTRNPVRMVEAMNGRTGLNPVDGTTDLINHLMGLCGQSARRKYQGGYRGRHQVSLDHY